jgi:serine/threonine protein kinase
MDTIQVCKQCQQPLPENAPEGLCPACLAKVALGDEPSPSSGTINVSPLAEAATSPAPAMAGRVHYFGDYELREEIARGGMGVVYKARQVSLNRLLAVKMILAGQLAGEAEVKRFRTEAEAAAQLQHPNIVAIHEVGEHEGQHYYSMDLVVGPSLAARLGQGPLPIGEAARLMKTIAEAVEFAHQRGIIHRDLKPANVLLDQAGAPRVTDFGLAKRLERGESLTASGAMLGTPDYMSPEQAAGRHDITGPPADIFSLGAMLYQMITGRVPFRGANLSETLSNILHNEPIRPSRINPRVSADLETICLKCLEKRPDRRYPTGEALAQDLERFLNHEPVSARPTAASKRCVRWLKNHPWLAAGFASAIVLGLIWFSFALWSENRILVWEKAHPSEPLPSDGEWIQDSHAWMSLARIMIFVIVGLQNRLRERTRARIITGRFVSRWTLASFELAGATVIGLSVWLGAAEIQSWLWAKHSLPHARAELEAELAKEANAEAQSVEQLKKLNEQIQGVQERPRNEASRRLLSALQLHRSVLEGTIGFHRALQPSTFKQTEVTKIENRARPGWLAPGLMVPTFGAWLGAGLLLRAYREHTFVFYQSVEEEQAAIAVAVEEQKAVAAKKARQMRNSITFMGIPLLLLLMFPYFYWGSGQQPEAVLVLIWSELSAFFLALVVTLRAWRTAFFRAWALLLGLAVAGAVIVGPALLVARCIGFGAATGAVFGVYYRWSRKRIAAKLASIESAK